jgi:hypothetical protein
MSNIIKFFNWHEIPDGVYPRPAGRPMPKWWQEMNSYGGWGPNKDSTERKVDINSGMDNASIKRCQPIIDSMTLGYIIKTHAELYIESKHNDSIFLTEEICPAPSVITTATYPRRVSDSPNSGTSFHPFGQAMEHPYSKKQEQHLLKIFTPWTLKTPPGYSVIFHSPLNDQNEYFDVVPGVMDSDQFFPKLNFMIALKDKNFNGIIPAGTPLIQVIPFKREKWEMVIDHTKEGMEDISGRKSKIDATLATVFHQPYRKLFWSKKEFK